MAKFDLGDGDYQANGARIAIAASRFNQHIVGPLLEGAYEALVENGVSEHTIEVVRVPGAFELPVTAVRLAQSGRFDAVVCLGAVVRGDTPHFEFVSGECARGLMEAGLMTGKPVIFGVLTTNTEQQALDRPGGSEGNKGAVECYEAIESFRSADVDKCRRW